MTRRKSKLRKICCRDGNPPVIHRQYITDEYACSTCSTTYATLKKARACVAMGVEKPKFKVGDRVTWREPVVCTHRSGRGRAFRIRATVVRVHRPEPMDEEYCNKWLEGACRKMHVRMLEVAFPCACGRKRSMLLYGAETEPISALRKKSRKKK